MRFAVIPAKEVRLFYRIEPSEAAAPADLQVLEEGLREAAELPWQREPYRQLTYFVRDGRGGVLGGIAGNTGGPWLYVAALWVAPGLRGQGIGTRLMDAAEAEAIARGCTGAYLDTFSEPALAFYHRRGYRHFGRLDAGGAHPVRHFLRRDLARAPGAVDTASLAAHRRPEDLVVEAAVVAADVGAATGDPDQAVDEGRPVHAVNGNRQVAKLQHAPTTTVPPAIRCQWSAVSCEGSQLALERVEP